MALHRAVALVMLLTGAAVFTACAALRGPDFAELFPTAQHLERRPLIVIPGLLGSGLEDAQTGERIWPPNLAMLIRGWRIRDLVVPLPYEDGPGAARLRPVGIVRSGPGRDYYASLLDTLAEVGYECVARHEVERDTDCVLFSWDWRLGVAPAAAGISDLVERMRSLRGDPDLEFDLVAHSAGALLARYYVRFGSENVLDRDAAVPTLEPQHGIRRAVLIGPPNDGAVVGAQGLMRGYRIGVFNVRPEILATFETAYQLLPHPGRDWLADMHGRSVQRDIYDVETWRELGESIFHPDVRERVASRFDSPADARRHLQALEERFARALARAERLHERLSYDLPEDAPVEYVMLGSDCRDTLRRAVLETVDGEAAVRLHPDELRAPIPGVDYEALMLEPGDGRVTRSSLLARRPNPPDDGTVGRFPIRDIVFVCERHSEMASNFEVRHSLLEFLLN